MHTTPATAVCIFVASLCLKVYSDAGDWPAYRFDAGRAGRTPEQLELPLNLVWTYQPGQSPRPAWPEPMATNYAVMHGPLQQTLSFDNAFHVVADEQAVYFGSSADDSICCLDAETGAVRWRYVTGGPVRMPPALRQGRLFAGSDDGYLYALDSQSGKLLWKHRPGLRDQRLPGNGRMISLWPVRSGPVVEADSVFFTAGLFPDRGVFLCSLDAATGKELFTRSIDVAAQGIMLVTSNRLFIPSGRQQYWSCEKKEEGALLRHGAPEPWRSNLVGGCSAVVTPDFLATGPSEDGQFHWFKPADKAPFLRMKADCLIPAADRVYLLSKGVLSALDSNKYLHSRQNGKGQETAWSVPASGLKTMIMAGEKLIAAGRGVMAVFDGRDGKKLWEGQLEGNVESLAFCNGRLFVSLDDGRTACYGHVEAVAAIPRRVVESVRDNLFPENSMLVEAAETAIRNAGTTKGYCLVLQAGTGQLAWEIARRSQFRVICVEDDREKAAALAAVFTGSGLYGHRLEVHHVESGLRSFPRYFANLVVSEGVLTEDRVLPPADSVLRVLRPCGGVVDMAAKAGSRAAKSFRDWGTRLPDWQVSGGACVHGTARRGRLPGSGEWTHFYADPSNSACSGDEIRPVPMELQWFGRPGPRDMVDRHKKGPAPLFANGRLFISGFNHFSALDAYNGFVLWERSIPDSVRVGAFRDSSNIAAAGNHLFVAAGDSCLVLDAQTGETVQNIPAAGVQATKAWGYLAVVEGLVVGSVARPGGSLRAMGKAEDSIIWRNEKPVVCSSALFAVERQSGRTAWEYRARLGAIPNPSIAIGDGRIYFVESRNGVTLESPTGRNSIPDIVGQGAQLVALDLKSGAILWEKPAGLEILKHILYLSCADGTLVITGTRYTKVDPAETKGRRKPDQLNRIRYDLFAFDARSGELKWKATAVPDYDEVLTGDHGEQVQHPAIANGVVYGPGFAFHLDTGKPYEGWTWNKSHKCATLSMSRYCAFSRFSEAKVPYIFDLKSGAKTPLSVVTRPGCWINTIPAGGLILIPEASAGCTCPYPIQASLAFAPAEE